MRGLEGKRAIVTGAARGIGRAIAERLTREGTRVALVDVDADALGEAATALGRDAFALPADVRDEDAHRAGVLHVLRFIDHDRGPFDFLEVLAASLKEPVGNDDHVALE